LSSSELGPFGSNIGFSNPTSTATRSRNSGRVTGCCTQAGMPNPLFHQITRNTVFLKDGNSAVAEGVQPPTLQTELI